jgi:hypothetical protein
LWALPKGGAHFFGSEMAKATAKRGGASNTGGARKSRRELITALLAKIEMQLDSKTTKVTLTDFIRLIQLQRELEQEEQPAEVIVTWRDLSEKPSTGK